MVVTSEKSETHVIDLEELLKMISNQRKLNLENCVFGVQAGKFPRFLLIERGIIENTNKCVVIVGMRSPNIVKEIQRLIDRMAALSRFLLANGDKGYPYFQCL